MLVHLVSAENEDVAAAYRTIRGELEAFDSALIGKKEMIVLSKTDMVSEERKADMLRQLPEGAVPLTALDDAVIGEFSTMLSRALGSVDSEESDADEN